MTSLRILFRGIYKRCHCGCGMLIKFLTVDGYPARFMKGHHSKFIRRPNTFRENNNNWKGGRKKNHKYWVLLMPDYFSTPKGGYIKEHIYFYQEYYKCCLLPWGVVHHKDGNKENNMPWNLQGMMRRDHIILHNKLKPKRLGIHKTSGRICYLCKSNKTSIKKPSGTAKTPFEKWLHLPHDKINWYCHKCAQKEYYYRSRKKLNLLNVKRIF